MIKKRILAKVLDVLIYVPIVSVIYSIILTIIDKSISKDLAGTLTKIQAEYSEAITQENKELANEILVENVDFLMQFTLVSFVITALVLMIVVTIFGKIFKGSIGKKVMKLEVRSTVKEKVGVVEFLTREPLVYVHLTSIFTFLFFMFIYPSRLVYMVGSLAFVWALLLLVVSKPFWGTISKTCVVGTEKQTKATDE